MNISEDSDRLMKKHSRFLDNIISRNLIAKLDFTKREKPYIRKYWKELEFNSTCISLANQEGIPQTIASPDLLIYSTISNGQESNLTILEAKINRSQESIRNMRNQLKTEHDYIMEHPEHLIKFLEREGLSDREIDSLRIGFCGVTATRHERGLREEVYFDLCTPEKCYGN